MAILYKKYQNKNEKSKTYGKWYGRALTINNVSTEDLAEEISASTTVTTTDVFAVLRALGTVIRQHLQNSESVTFDRIGTFRVGLKTTPADDVEKFTAQNVSGYRINYQPEKHFVPRGVNEKGNRVGVFINDLLEGITAKEAPKNLYGKDGKKKSDGSDSGSDVVSPGK